jgi:hypothetical protein
MQIFKGQEISKDVLSSKIRYIENYYKDLVALNDGNDYPTIAKEHKVSVPALQKRFMQAFAEIEEIEPRVKDLYLNFDTYLNLRHIITKEWVLIISRLVSLRVPYAFQSSIDKACVVDKKLKHRKVIIKSKHKPEYESITSEFLKEISGNIPCRIEDFAKEKKLNPEKVQELLNDLLPEKVCNMDGWILSTRKSLFRSIIIYGSDEKISYDGTLLELFEKFWMKYESLFKSHGVNNYDDFKFYIKRKIDSFGRFVCVDKKTNEYETKKKCSS